MKKQCSKRIHPLKASKWGPNLNTLAPHLDLETLEIPALCKRVFLTKDYRNSILQCIFATPFLNDIILSDFKNMRSSKPQRLAEAYYNLIKQVKVNHETLITPSDLK